jgi:hypothetical protein
MTRKPPEPRKPGRPKKVHGGGRPTLMTPETVKKLEDAFLMGCSDLEACLVAGISKQTLYNYQAVNPEFVDRKELLKENPVMIARNSVVAAMRENGELALKYLERKRKDEFSTKSELAHSGRLETLTDAELEAKLKGMLSTISKDD